MTLLEGACARLCLAMPPECCLGYDAASMSRLFLIERGWYTGYVHSLLWRMKHFLLLGALMMLPIVARAHDGHADAPAPATEFVHYLSPTHLAPVAIAIVIGIVIGKMMAVRSRERSSNNK